MLIDDGKCEIGSEIDCGIHRKGGEEFRVTIRKISDTEWIAYKYIYRSDKLFRTRKEVVLRRGDLNKIVDYVNRNFGYNDEVAG